MKKIVRVVICSVLLAAGLAWGQETSVKSMPPSVVKTVPQSGDTTVDTAVTKQITVTFSKEMRDGSWSWATVSKETAPEILGKPQYLDDKRTCVAEVKLEPKKTYILWLNSQKFGNFKDTEGNTAVPYLLVFQTK
jgi:RNA polymerase sigma-70 factor (ECF subfamily)